MSFTKIIRLNSFRPAVSFLEILIIILILGILVVVSIPNFRPYYGMKLDIASKNVLSDIRYAQTIALSNHEEVGVRFLLDENAYELYRVSDEVRYRHPLTQQEFIIDFDTHAQFSGIVISAVDSNGTQGIRFSSMGQPRDENGIDLTNNAIITLSYQGVNQNILVSPQTGYARVQ